MHDVNKHATNFTTPSDTEVGSASASASASTSPSFSTKPQPAVPALESSNQHAALLLAPSTLDQCQQATISTQPFFLERQMLDEPTVVQTERQSAAVIHLTIPRSEIQNAMGPGHNELMTALKAQGLTPTGPWFTHHFRMDPAIFDFEIGVPVGAEVKSTGRVKAGSLPASKVARTTYRGGYEGLGPAWGEFEAWLKANGHAAAPDLWEVYAAGPETGPDASQYRTELNRPIVD